MGTLMLLLLLSPIVFFLLVEAMLAIKKPDN